MLPIDYKKCGAPQTVRNTSWNCLNIPPKKVELVDRDLVGKQWSNSRTYWKNTRSSFLTCTKNSPVEKIFGEPYE